jgi:GTP cyclohydrolase I
MMNVGWFQARTLVRVLADRILESQSNEIVGVYGVPTGGCIVAWMLQAETALRPDGRRIAVLDELVPGCVVVDDLIDSGATAKPFIEKGHPVAVLVIKGINNAEPGVFAARAIEPGSWVQFPWEHTMGIDDAIVRLLQFVGEDPLREGLRDTPGRVGRSMLELTAGYKQDPAEILSRVFADGGEGYDQMVVLREIKFTSLCEHHLLPFQGTATVGYVPDGSVVGISKLARLVECFARRLQVQERMTVQIAQAIEAHLAPLGTGVVIRAHHSCMGCRGVKQEAAVMVTSAMYGVLREKPEARAEFLSL